MFDMFYKKKSELSESDAKLAKIADLLFPNFEVHDGFAVDSSVDSNLEAALTDLREGYLDDVSIGTLERILKKIMQVREVMQVYPTLVTDVDRYVLTMGPDQSDLDPESIKPAEED